MINDFWKKKAGSLDPSTNNELRRLFIMENKLLYRFGELSAGARDKVLNDYVDGPTITEDDIWEYLDPNVLYLEDGTAWGSPLFVKES
jgi:hypothetical protein